MELRSSGAFLILIMAALPVNAASPTIESRIPVPEGSVREPVAAGSFGEWLRKLPLKPSDTPVRFYDGRLKQNQNVHCAVVDIDVGDADLQQCADAVIRLRAEYLFSTGKALNVVFHFTSGDAIPFARWAEGYRPKVVLNKVFWVPGGEKGASHGNFRRYLDVIFRYAGTKSLEKELKPVTDVAALEIGDVFVQGGAPGHAVIVVDTASDPKTGKRVFLLAQSYMPAQDIHVLKSYSGSSPWFPADFGETLRTPEWTFKSAHLRRF
ncbi:MAG: DUF4846 domain-containing protein [Myxococcota bacterium]